MINLEKYKENFIKEKLFTIKFFGIKEETGQLKSCRFLNCQECKFNPKGDTSCNKERINWLLEEYDEPPIDWNKVERNTAVMVYGDNGKPVFRRFADFLPSYDKPIVTYNSGFTRYSASNYEYWKYGRLAKPIEIAKYED